MIESGIHHYITVKRAPSLPQCDQQSSYQSARINDIATALLLFFVGVLLGLMLLLCEYLWKKKKRIFSKMRKTYRSLSQSF